MKRFNRKGFTLAELLIVVAIIAVMAAIAIPIFTAQLAKAKAGTDLANIRSGYAAASSELLTSSATDADKKNLVWTLNTDGTVTEAKATATTGTTVYKTQGNSNDLGQTGWTVGGLTTSWTSGQKITYTVDATTLKLKITPASAS